MAGNATALAAREAAPVTNSQKITPEDEFDVPARWIDGKTARKPATSAALADAALVFSHPIRFHWRLPVFGRFFEYAHAIIAVLSTHP
jgi:hypothetical protein